eukprot:GEZU01042561.1.p1 GENE.GEZU01042561.1~~GEZU01042561.1.p1  ORF type:complete len:512 (-),score=170.77 GEZU01042561.1:24-1559(-)
MATLQRNLNLRLDSTSSTLKTKIICTIGEKTQSKEILKQFIENGMSVVRLNCSHGSHEFHLNVLKNLREATEELKLNRAIPVMLDLKGPEIRTGKLKTKNINLTAGSEILLTTDTSILGDTSILSIDYPQLPQIVSEGSQLLIADGLVGLTVLKVNDDKTVLCRVENSAKLGQQKNVYIHGGSVDYPSVVTEQDKRDIKFALDNGITIIAAPLVRSAKDILEVRQAIGEENQDKLKIVAKVKSEEGLRNFDEILKLSDGIFIARGYLGLQLPLETVFASQKYISSKCNAANKPVIIGTQLLDSMIVNPRPTRAEATDVANAVLDGADAVLLTGETAIGDYPLEAVKILNKICRQAEAVEASADYTVLFEALRKASGDLSIADSIASLAVRNALDTKASLIVTITETGLTSRLLSKYRPPVPIIAVTPNVTTAQHLEMSRAVITCLVDQIANRSTESLVTKALTMGLEKKLIDQDSQVVVVSGVIEGVPGKTNTIKTLRVSEWLKMKQEKQQ